MTVDANMSLFAADLVSDGDVPYDVGNAEDDLRYLMLGEEGCVERPPCDTWCEESGAFDIAGLEEIAQLRTKAERHLASICQYLDPIMAEEQARGRSNALKELLSLDVNHFLRDSHLPDASIIGIWESASVSSTWKVRTLAKMMEAQMYGIMMIPLEYEKRIAHAAIRRECDPAGKDYPNRCNVLRMLHAGDFDTLNRLLGEGRLGVLRGMSGIWAQVLFHLILLADYDSATSDGNGFIADAVRWIESVAPGTLASGADRFGNNALMYLYGVLQLTNPTSLMRTRDGIEMAREDARFLIDLGCNPEQKNIFDVSYAMVNLNDRA